MVTFFVHIMFAKQLWSFTAFPLCLINPWADTLLFRLFISFCAFHVLELCQSASGIRVPDRLPFNGRRWLFTLFIFRFDHISIKPFFIVFNCLELPFWRSRSFASCIYIPSMLLLSPPYASSLRVSDQSKIRSATVYAGNSPQWPVHLIGTMGVKPVSIFHRRYGCGWPKFAHGSYNIFHLFILWFHLMTRPCQ